ncbi:hypothetical protein [Lelliottia sp.]|uniref:hypothetical protein n=1 Tax=Lelliottia sp. TaxID=1898429 RepID=UPI0038905BEB
MQTQLTTACSPCPVPVITSKVTATFSGQADASANIGFANNTQDGAENLSMQIAKGNDRSQFYRDVDSETVTIDSSGNATFPLSAPAYTVKTSPFNDR